VLISFNWLVRHIDLSGISAERAARDLTLSTAEVEGVEEYLPHAREVFVGHVLHAERHPDAERLRVCRVNVGRAAPAESGTSEGLSIVCGAANVAAGQKVAVALPGTGLPGIGKLKQSKIRGVVSEGMICSEKELGLGEESDGIWVLPDALDVGASLYEALGIGDWVITIDNKSLTHRPDLWGHRGIARELAAIYRRQLKPLDLSPLPYGQGAPVPVVVESGACSRYVAQPIDGIQALPSPLWLRLLLGAVGQRSLGQLVDVSNFVMLDLGQPNHVFDQRRLKGGIEVRPARSGERFVALDGRALALVPEDLLIGSGGEGVALAGVIGGEATEVRPDTRSILLEVATFDPVSVRRTAVRHALRTESSARFEKSLDPELPPAAAAHFTRVLQQLQPALTLPAPPSDVRRFEPKSKSIRLRPRRVREALGAELTDAEILDLLGRLGFVASPEGDAYQVRVPSERATKDIGIEQDLIEEVGRLYGYGNIPERSLVAPVEPARRDERRLLVRKIQDRLAGSARFTETISYSMQADALLELLGLSELPHVVVANPIVTSESRVRRSLVPSLLGRIEANRRHQDVVRLFEVGKCYLPERPNDRHEPEEQHRVGLLLATPKRAAAAHFHENSFAELQGVIDDVLSVLERPRVSWHQEEAPEPWAHPVRCLRARYPSGKVAATLGALRPDAAHQLGLKGKLESDIALAEISIDAALAEGRAPRVYQALPRFPGIKVDVAVAVAKSFESGAVVQAIAEAAGNQLKGVELFDIYTGPAVGEAKKSLAYHVLLAADDRTLADADEQKFLRRVRQKLEAIGAELRDG
jgi:phenylalanyl-tRNA synthetase beta chain